LIRHATFADIDACVDVFEKANSLSENYSSFDRDICGASLKVRLFNPYSLVLVNEKLDGVVVGVASPCIYAKSMKVGNEFLYAESEGLALVRGYLRWARGWGEDADIMLATSFGGALGERAERLFSLLGAQPIGTQFKVI